ncbi:hypothetical protein PFNF54_02473 [Plasmodium falciparum NF54]|uniref:Uncharacterized protein n=1 Tax=Plasmodium falciparum (isolate NF54) TaxID=5843 RepID=W7K5Q3_PLAFO|nr:hypothetical protein PFNF54_02473 [Plasmodium falciparum NF54]
MENNLIKEHDPASINSTSCYSKNMLHDSNSFKNNFIIIIKNFTCLNM